MKFYVLKLVFTDPDGCITPFAAKDDRDAVLSGLRSIKAFLEACVECPLNQFYIDTMEIGTVSESGEIQTVYPFRLFDSAADPDINLLNDDELGEYLTVVKTIRPRGSRD
jgi:hypothetical protein